MVDLILLNIISSLSLAIEKSDSKIKKYVIEFGENTAILYGKMRDVCKTVVKNI